MLPEPTRDVAKAKQLLADAGYADGLKVTLTAQQISPVPAIATILKEQLAEAGINVDIQLVPSDVYYGADNLWLEADFAITDWGSRAYPQPYLDLAYVCNAKWNESHWCDKELDDLSKQAAVEMDRAKRAELYQKIQQIFIDRGPIIVPFFAQQPVGRQHQAARARADQLPGHGAGPAARCISRSKAVHSRGDLRGLAARPPLRGIGGHLRYGSATQICPCVEPSRLALTWRRLRRYPATLVGIAIVGFFLLMAVFGTTIAPYPYTRQKLADRLQAALQRAYLWHRPVRPRHLQPHSGRQPGCFCGGRHGDASLPCCSA